MDKAILVVAFKTKMLAGNCEAREPCTGVLLICRCHDNQHKISQYTWKRWPERST